MSATGRPHPSLTLRALFTFALREPFVAVTGS
jgi:hypothetical protein